MGAIVAATGRLHSTFPVATVTHSTGTVFLVTLTSISNLAGTIVICCHVQNNIQLVNEIRST